MTSYSLNNLKRWSCLQQDLPLVDQIKHIHVYDFDNTLFATPLPNKQLWNTQSLGYLMTQDTFANGGWWHNNRFLSAVGEGMDKEEHRGWKGWWNESIVDLVMLTMQQKDALSVLLTGRSEKGYADLLQRIAKSRGLQFDLMALRPEVGPFNEKFASTMKFKQVFLTTLMHTYNRTEEIRIYEDRPKHAEGFRSFLENFSTELQTTNPERMRLHTQVIEVTEESKLLDPVTETQEVQSMINQHNEMYRNGQLPGNAKPWRIRRQVMFTGYLIAPEDTEKLLAIAQLPPQSNLSENGIRTLANNIMITPRPAPAALIGKVGGLGKCVLVRVTHLGSYNSEVWAARVEAIPNMEKIYSEDRFPYVVLALRGRRVQAKDANRITDWYPVSEDQSITFEAIVGEKVLLRIDQEYAQPMNGEAFKENRGAKRPFTDEDFPALGLNHQSKRPSGRPDQQSRPYHTDENRRRDAPRGGMQENGRGRMRGGGGPRRDGNRDRGCQRGGGHSRDQSGRGNRGRQHRSLDDDPNQYGTRPRGNVGGLSY